MAKILLLIMRSLMSFAAAAILLLAASSPATAAGRCEVDAGGGCVRSDGFPCSPSSDSPPAAGKCYTVKQERVLKCLCLAKAPTSRIAPYSPANTPFTGRVSPLTGRTPTTQPSPGSNAECIMKCDRQQIACRAEAHTEEEMLRCGRIFQACLAECNAPRLP